METAGRKYKNCHGKAGQVKAASLTTFDYMPYARAAGAFVLMLAMALVVIEVVYGFHGGIGRYIEGLLLVNGDHDPDYLTYLGGQLRYRFPNYFVVAYLLKEPVAALILAGLGVLQLLRTRKIGILAKLFLLLPRVVLFTIHSMFADGLGVRYVIGVLPFTCLAGGVALASMVKSGEWTDRESADSSRRAGGFSLHIRQGCPNELRHRSGEDQAKALLVACCSLEVSGHGADVWKTCTSGVETAAFWALIRRVAGPKGSALTRFQSAGPAAVVTPIPSGDRRAVVLRAMGAAQLLYRAESTGRVRERRDRVHVYVDVSGSIGELKGALYGAVLDCRDAVHPAVHLFSTVVRDVSFAGLRNGECRTTAGTSIECVASHIQKHGVRRAVLLTDGWVGRPGAGAARTLAGVRLGVALTPGANRGDLKSFVRHWAELEMGDRQ